MTIPNPTILVVDNDSANLDLRSRILRQAGFAIIEAQTGGECLSLVTSARPALVLLDMHLPDIDGAEVCRRIKQDSAFGSVFVLCISASLPSPIDKAHALEGGADGYLSEPVEPEELLATVRALLRLHQAEERLRTSELRFRQMANVMPAIVLTSDAEGRLTFVNQRWLEYTGLSLSETLAVGAWPAIHPDDSIGERALWEAAVASGQSYLSEYRLRRHDGIYRWHQERAEPEYNDQGQVVQWFHNVSDIEERKVIEERLYRSEEELRYTVELNPQVPWTADAAGNIINFNQRWLALTGLTHTAALGEGWMKAMHPVDQPAMEAAWTHAIQTGEPYDIEHRIHLADGAYRWMRSRAFPRRNAAGEIVRWYGTSEDIHERKMAEEQLRQANSRFERAERAAHGFAFESDLVKGVVVRSANFSRVTGYALDEVPATPEGWLQLVHPDDLASFKAGELLVAGRTNYTSDYRVRHKAGYYLWVQEQGLIERDEQGQPLAVVGTTVDISARKAVQEALRASEAQLRTILENIPAAVYMLSPDHRYLYVNRLFAKSYNQKEANIVGRSVFDRFPPEIANPLAENERRVLEARIPMNFEEAAPRNGEMRYYTTVKAPMLNDVGEPYAVIGISLDITDSKRAAESLRASEERYRQIFEQTVVGIDQATVDGKLLAVNPGFCQMLGYSADELLAINSFDLTHPDDRAVTLQMLNEAQSKQRDSYTIEKRLLHKDGHPIWVSLTATAVRDATGNILFGVAITQDITARKEAEAALRQVEAHLRQQAMLLDQAHEAIIIWTLNGVIRYWNRGAEELYGWASHEVLGQVSHQLLQTVHPMSVAEFEQTLREKGHWSGEVQHCTRQGQQLIVESRYVVMQQEDGVYVVLETNRDNTERKRNEERLAFNTYLLENIQDAVIAFTPDYRITAWNRGAELLYGYTATEALGASSIELLHPVSTPEQRSTRMQAIEHSGHIRVETIHHHRNGTPIAIEAISIALPEEGEGIRGYLTINRDITERKAREAALLISQQRLQLALAAAQMGVWELDIAAQRVYWSPEVYQLSGATDFDGSLASADHAVHPDDLPAVRAKISQAIEEHLPYQDEYRVIHPDGRVHWLTVQGRVEYADDGAPLHLRAVIQDITARKQAELNQQFLLDLDAQIRSLGDVEALLALAAQALGQYLNVAHCTFNEINLAADQGLALTHWRRNAEWPNLTGPHKLSTAMGLEMAATLSHGQSVTVNDVEHDPRTAGLGNRYATAHVQSIARAPFKLKDALLAVLAVADDQPRTWQPDEVRLLEEVIARVWPLVIKARAERDLRRQEEFARRIADNVPGLVGYLDRDESYRFVNATFEAWFQQPREAIVNGTVLQLLGAVDYERFASYRQHALIGESVTYEDTLSYPDGVTRAVWGRYQPDIAADGTVQGFYLFVMDISERKQAEADAHFLADLAEQIRLAHDAAALLWTVSQQVGDYLQVGRAHFIEVDQASKRLLIHQDYCRGLPSVAGEFSVSDYNQATWSELAAGRTLVNEDTEHDPRTAAIYATTYQPAQEGAGIAVPLLRSGQWQGIFSVTMPTARHWQPREIHLMETVAERVWLAVEKLRLDAEQHRSEEQLRQIADNLPGLISVVNERHEYEFVNQNYQRWFGVEKIIGQPKRTVIGEAAYAVEQPYLARALAGETVTFENRLTTPAGITRDLMVTMVPRRQSNQQGPGCYVLSLDITERKRAEEALRQNEERLHLALAAANAGGWSYDLVADTAHWSLEMYSLYGLDPTTNAPPLGHFAELIHPHDRERVDAELTAAATRGGPFSLEFRLLRPAGQEVWINSSGVVELNEQGRPVAARGIDQDISQRKQAELALQQSNAILNGVLESSNDAIFVRDLTGRYLLANRMAAEQVQMSREQLVGHRYDELFSPAEVAQMRQEDDLILLQGHSVIREHFTDHHGLTSHWHTVKVPLRNEGGQIIGLISSARDITERKQAEDALRQSEEIARQRLAELEVIYDTAPIGLCVLDRDLRWLRINERLAEINGFSVAEHLGRSVTELLPDLAPTVQQWLDLVTATNQPLLNIELQGETPAQPGVKRTWREHCFPLHAQDGSVIGINIVAEEITELKRQEEQQQFLSDLFTRLRLLSSPKVMLDEVVTSLGQHLGADSCRMNAIDLGRETFTVQENWGGNRVMAGSVYPLDELGPPAIVAALRAGATVVVTNTGTDPRTASVSDVYRREDVTSFIGVPIFYEGAWRATLSVKDQGERHWYADEVRLLETVAHQFSALLEKVRAEEALRRSEARYRTIFENAGVSLWEEDFSLVQQAVDELTRGWRAAGVTDLATTMRQHCAAHPEFVQAMLKQVRILDVNQETVRLYGVSKAELLKPFEQFFASETLLRFVDELVMIASGGGRYTFDGPIQTPEGETRHLAFTVVFPQEAEGRLDRVLVSGLDITALKETEDQLRASEERLHLALEAGNMAAFEYVVATNSVRRSTNAQILQGLGEYDVGDNYYQYVHADERAELRRRIDGVTPQQPGYEYEYRFQRPDNDQTIWLLDRGQGIFDVRGRLQRLTGMVIDISERRRREAQGRFLADLGDAMVHIQGPAELLGEVAQRLGEFLGVSRSFFLENTPEQEAVVVHHNYHRPGLASIAGVYPKADFDPDSLAAMATGRTVVIPNTQSPPVTPRQNQHRYDPFNIRSMVSIPLLRNEQWMAGLVVIDDKPCQWREEDVNLIRTVAERAWLAVENRRLFQETETLLAQLEAMLDNAPIGLAFFDEQSRFVRINQAMASMNNLSMAEHLNRPLSEVLPTNSARLLPWIQEVFASGQGVYNLEMSWPLPTNPSAVGYTLISYYPIKVGDETRFVGCSALDITDRKRAEEEVRTSQRFLQSIADTTPNLLYLFDLRTMSNRYANRQITTMLGYTPQDIQALGEQVMPMLMHPEDLRYYPQHVEHLRTLADGEVAEWEYRMCDRDGAWHWLGGREIVFERDQAGQPCVILGAVQDITTRKQVEIALRMSEERFRQLANSMPQLVWRNDRNGRVEYLNQQWLDYTGLTLTESLHDTRQVIHPDDLPAALSAWQQAQADGTGYEVELRMRRYDGAYGWFLSRTVPVRNEAGEIINWYGTATDIKALKEAEDRLRQLNATLDVRVQERTAELERSNRELDKFAYVASHDLKSPLRAIENLAQWISSDAGSVLPAESKVHLEKMQGRVRRMEKLLDDLLGYSRAGRYQYKIERVDVQQLVQDAIELLAPPPGFTFTLDTEVPVYVGQRVPLETVLRNLIGNAIKHHDRPDGHIWVTAQDQGDRIEFVVGDDGPGIDPKFHERIFDLFQTLQPRDKVEGSGMGLAIVKKLIEALGGTITVESKEGAGAMFCFVWIKA